MSSENSLGLSNLTDQSPSSSQDLQDESYKLLFFKNPLPSWIYDLETMQFLQVNDAAVKHYGYSSNEFLTLCLLDIRPEEDREEFKALYEKSRKQPIIRHPRLRHLTKEGKIIYVDVYTNDITYANRACRLAVVNDVTELIHAHKEQKESNERFQLAAEATSDVVYDWDLITNHLNWSIGITTLFGYHPSEITIDKWAELLHPDDRDRIVKSLHDTLENPIKKYWKEEYRFKRSDGAFSYVQEKGFIVRNENTIATRMIGAIQDITEIKLKEQELFRNKERFELAVKATSDIIWDWDFITKKVIWSENYSHILGWELPKDRILPSDTCLTRFHPEDRKGITESIQNAINEPTTILWKYDFRYQKKDGSYAYVNDRGYIIRNNEGKALRMIGAMQDITERKMLEIELLEKELDKQKQISQATIVTQEKERGEIGKELHDNVNQILTTTKLYLDLSLSNPELKDELIQKSSKNIIYVINEIRQLSRSLMNPSLGDLGLADSINDLIESIHTTRKLRVNFDTVNFSEASLDSQQSLMVFRIIQEALNNAIKHARASSVLVKMAIKQQILTLVIQDNGIGFEPQVIKKGAGLNNIQNRVYLSNGTLSIESTPGKGCTIEIIIPI